MLDKKDFILFLSALCSALMAGLFYAYSCSVNPGLGRLPDAAYLSAMQNINRAIQNPLFFVSFFGILIFLPLCTYLHYEKPLPRRFVYLALATGIYAAGVFGVTALGNIPLNESLDHFQIANASAEELSRQRQLFEKPWNTLNGMRTVASFLSLTFVILACLTQKKP